MSVCIFCKNRDHEHEDRPDRGGLSVRVTNALWNKFGPCVKWEQVAALSRRDYKKMKNLGRESINQLERALNARGLCFTGDTPLAEASCLAAIVAFRRGQCDWSTCLAAMDAYVASLPKPSQDTAEPSEPSPAPPSRSSP